MADNEAAPHDQEELIAYLDGELDADGVRRVEERLARDADYERQLRGHERAWRLLDGLPAAVVGEHFTKTTMEMVALDASREAEAVVRDRPRQRRRQRIAAAASMALALACGFVVGTRLWPDPNLPLLADLRVIENLDLYYQADDINFLRLLDAKDPFHDNDADGPRVEPGDQAAEPTDRQRIAERRQQVAALPEAAQHELWRKYERFRALPADEQQRLREFEAAISDDPQAARLRGVLERYHEWLKTITASQRAELAELPPAARAERVAGIRRVQRATQQAQVLSRRDTREITHWIHQLVQQHQADVLADMSAADRARFEKSDDASQQRWLMYRTFGGRRSQNQSRVSQQDIDRLEKKLSDAARAELAKSEGLEAKRRVVGAWIFATVYRSESHFGGGRRVSPLVGEELFQFLQTDVPPAQREELLKMPQEEMLRELRKMYFARDGERRPFGPGRRSE